jgi:DNA-binding PucR family transcriptional regulator
MKRKRQQPTGGYVEAQVDISAIAPRKAQQFLQQLGRRLCILTDPTTVPGTNNRDNAIVSVRYPRNGSVWGAFEYDIRSRVHEVLDNIGSRARVEVKNTQRTVTKRRSWLAEEAL